MSDLLHLFQCVSSAGIGSYPRVDSLPLLTYGVLLEIHRLLKQHVILLQGVYVFQ